MDELAIYTIGSPNLCKHIKNLIQGGYSMSKRAHSLLISTTILPLVICLTLDLSWAQVTPSQITGTVLERGTGNPLQGVNIYLANTSYGAATDPLGRYELPNVLPGKYTMVISHLGYKRKMMDIAVHNHSGEQVIDLMLNQVRIQMPEITVKAKISKEWKRRLSDFTEEFIGKTSYGQKTEILNPEVLRFRFEKKSKVLRVYAVDALILENRALGYRINLVLIYFQWNLRSGSGQYRTLPHFQELTPKNKRQERRWKRNRKYAFVGSMRHFMSELYENGPRHTSFTIQNARIQKLNNEERQLVQIALENQEAEHGVPLKVFKLERNAEIKYHDEGTSMLIPAESIYLYVDAFGKMANPNAFQIAGLWAKNRMANTLPFDYIPPKIRTSLFK